MAIDRREFLKRSAAISAAAACTPWLVGILGGSGCGPAMKSGFDETQIKAILANALTRGGDFSEVYIEDVTSLSLKMSEGVFSSATAGRSSGVGVRTVESENNGYAYINGADFSKALEAAATAAFIASAETTTVVTDPVAADAPGFVNVDIPIESITEDRKIELIQTAEDAARSYSDYVKQVDISYYDHVRKRTIANSYGLRIENEIPLIWVVIEVLAEKNGIRHQGRCRLSAHQGFEFFDTNDMSAAAIVAATEAVAMLDARPAPSGSMPVVMNSGWGGVLIHEAVGHGLEGDFIYKGSSIYTDKLGKKVGSSLVTLVDDSSWPNARGTTGFDDEGTIGRRNVLIEKGILKGYIHDLISARQLGVEPTGNGRRESYRDFPIPRMTNTFLENGDVTPDDIIADTDRGIFIKALSGGSVNEVSGQFNFVVREAYAIENGKITYPVSGATLIGKGIDVLTNIDAVGNNLKLGVGTCGKGQWVPVTSGVPTIRVADGLLVGGNA
ncbi:MAG: TldD/PmbA family protein [candidate division Zixibacteria bacterium]|nr:TldD/PmbA family protein [candidate division Zixibacteria bacterium]